MPDPRPRNPRPHRLRPPGPAAFAIDRERVTRAIHGAAARGIVVVSAPVGFGATTAVAQAVRPLAGVAWVSLDVLDADPMSLVVQVSHAIDRVTGGSTRLPRGSPLDAVSVVIEAWEARGVRGLVLDGVNARQHADSLAVLEYLCDGLPRDAMLVLTTHDRVATLPLSTLTGRLGVIEQGELALRPDEATQLVVEMCPALPADVVEELVATCEGWTAAAREVALHSHHHADARPIEWLRSHGCERMTVAALTSTTVDAGNLLMGTCFLDELSPSLCDAVLDRDDSAAVLAAAHDYGSLVTLREAVTPGPQPAGSSWTRHPLLTAGLRRRTFGQDLTGLHRRAATWYQAHGDVDRTMRHLIEAGDFAEAGQFFSLHEDALYASGDGLRAAGWYTTLPPEAWGRRGWHLLRAAWGRALTGDVRGAELAVDQLRSHLAGSSSPHPDEVTLVGEAELVTAYLAAMRGDADAIVRHAARAVDLADDATPVNSVQLAPVLLMRGLLWRGDREGCRRQLARIDRQPFPTDLIREAGLAAQTAHLRLHEGRVAVAVLLARRADQWLTSQGIDPKDVAQHALLIGLAAGEIESGRPDGLADDLEAIVADALARRYVGDAIDALRWQSRARMARADLSGALASIGRARALVVEEAPTSTIARVLDLQEAWVRHLAGDDVRARRLVQGLPAGDERTLLWARLIRERQGSRILGALAEVAATEPRSAADKQVVLASSALRRSSRLAETHLIQAADIAVEHGLGLLFLGSDDDLIERAILLGTRIGHDGLVSLAAAARDRFADPSSGGGRRVGPGAPPHPPSRRSMSPGELQLLAFLLARDTNDEIAQRLGISVNTVKTRLGRLYRKLGVGGRREAIAAARARGLVS